MHESKQLQLTIPGIPTSQLRHRIAFQKGFARAYDPSAKAKKQVELLAKAIAKQHEWVTQPTDTYHIEITFCLPYPANKKKANLATWRESYSRPDIDNLLKFYLDACNAIFWHDDQQITQCLLKKRLSNIPKTVITVTKKTADTLSCQHENILAAVSKGEVHNLARMAFQLEDAASLYNEQPNETNRNMLVEILKEIATRYSPILKRVESIIRRAKKEK